MPLVTVNAIVSDGDRVLLMRPAGSSQWALPAGVLAPEDDEVDDALVRVLADLGIDTAACEFLDTRYERLADGVVVHNLFAVTDADVALPEGGAASNELRWVAQDELADLPLPPWLAAALPALLAGESAPQPGLDLEAMVQFAEEMPGPASADAPDGAGLVLIVTGPCGAGKSTVAREWCSRFARAAHVAVDLLRHMVVSGHASPVPGESDPEEARRQGDLARLNACALARNFAAAGFDVVIDDVLEQPDELDAYLAELWELDVAFVTLLPDAETLRHRDEARGDEQRMGDRAAQLHAVFSSNGETRGLRLDTAAWDAEQTVDAIIERLDEARIPARGGIGA